MATTSPPQKISRYPFYNEWKGHPIEDLAIFRDIAQTLRPSKPIVYLAGDSSLDNKYWVPSAGPAGEPLPVEIPQIYNDILDKPVPKPDVAFFLNHQLGDRATCINTAVEESTLADRADKLLAHDEFIRDNIRSEDILVVSVGANDIALRPTTSTMRHMAQLAWFTKRTWIENGTASSLLYFKELLGTKVQEYVSRLVAKTKPRAVVICMIYFPLEYSQKQSSWADMQLKALGYNKFPGQLQAAIRKMYEMATCQIQIPGVEIAPCPLYEVMDGKHSEDYTARVEPSVQGGQKMANQLVAIFMRNSIIDKS